MDIHKYSARVTRTKFGRWFITSIFTDLEWAELFFRRLKTDMKNKALRFGVTTVRAEEIRLARGTDSGDFEIELTNGKKLYVVFYIDKETAGFRDDLRAIGVGCQ